MKTSSLGDVVHNLPVVSDLRAIFPDVTIDWVVEESLSAIPRLHPGVRRVIPLALRRWRRSLLSAQSWRELAAFRQALQAEAYDVVLDTQGLIKSGWVARQARLAERGRRCGYGAEAAREALAARFYDAGFAIPRNLHAVERNRWLAAAALGYVVDLPPDYGIAGRIAGAAALDWLPEVAYAVLFTATSSGDKLWPEQDWQRLAASLAQRGLTCILPAGTEAERQRATRLVQGMSLARVAPALTIAEIAGLCAGARLVVGLDTGLTHLAVALERPTLALFTATDPQLTGAYAGDPAPAWVRNLGTAGVAPVAEAASAAALELLG